VNIYTRKRMGSLMSLPVQQSGGLFPYSPQAAVPQSTPTPLPVAVERFNQLGQVSLSGPFSRVVSSVKSETIYPYFSVLEILQLRTLTRQEKAIIDEKYLLSRRIGQLLDHLSKRVQTLTGQIQNPRLKAQALIALAIDLRTIDSRAAEVTLVLAKEAGYQIPDPYQKVCILADIAEEQGKTNIVTATATLGLAQGAVNQILDRYQNVVDDHTEQKYIAMVAIQAKIDIEVAQNIVRHISRTSTKIRALIEIAREQSKTDIEASKETLALAKEAATKSPDSYLKTKALKNIAILQIETDAEAAMVTLEQAKVAAIEMDPFIKCLAFRMIAEMQIKIDVEAAKATLVLAKEAAIQDPGLFSKACVLMAIATMQGQTDREACKATLALAITTIDEIQNPYEKAHALIEIATVQAKVDVEASKDTLASAQVLAINVIQDPYEKARTLIEIARKQTKTDIKAAMMTLEQAKVQAIKIQELGNNADALKKIAAQQVKKNVEAGLLTLELAKKTARQIQDPFTKFRVLIDIGIVEAKVDDKAARLTLALAKEIKGQDFLQLLHLMWIASYLVNLLKEEVKFNRVGAMKTHELMEQAVLALSDPEQILSLMKNLRSVTY
jgi:hypothetical protein